MVSSEVLPRCKVGEHGISWEIERRRNTHVWYYKAPSPTRALGAAAIRLHCKNLATSHDHIGPGDSKAIGKVPQLMKSQFFIGSKFRRQVDKH